MQVRNKKWEIEKTDSAKEDFQLANKEAKTVRLCTSESSPVLFQRGN